MTAASDNAGEIDAYRERFKRCSPEELLGYMGEARDFFWKYMTPEGRRAFEESRFGKLRRNWGIAPPAGS